MKRSTHQRYERMGRPELQLLHRLRAQLPILLCPCDGCQAVQAGQIQRTVGQTPCVPQRDVDRRMGKIAKRAVMFPTTHDITPKTLGPCVTALHHLLGGGNRVLVTSKPHLECVKAICNTFADFRHMILFRFTIGAFDDDLLQYWEPGALPFGERLASLKYAFKHGFQTSVSIEPMLDSANVVRLFSKNWSRGSRTPFGSAR